MKDEKGRVTTKVTEYDALSTEHMIECKCCTVIRNCRLYTLQNGEAEWVCVGCREGTTPGVFDKPKPVFPGKIGKAPLR